MCRYEHASVSRMLNHVWCLVEGEAGVWSKIVLCLASHAQGLSTGSSAEGRAVAGKGLILPRGGKHVVFLELRRDSRVTTGISAFPLGWHWAVGVRNGEEA